MKYFICGDDLAAATFGKLVDDGNNIFEEFSVDCGFSLLKQDDLKSSKLNSGNACGDTASIAL